MPVHIHSAVHHLRLVDSNELDETLSDDQGQRWQLTDLLTRSRSADLYRARPSDHRDPGASWYVVKRVRHPDASNPVVRRAAVCEAAAGQLVSHPHLIPVLGRQTEHERPFIVMPYLSGESLDHVIHYADALPIPHALWITRQVAEATHALHLAGWLHGDIKPANIVVSVQGHATLIDLGSVLERGQLLPSFDRPLIGTLAYVAPEMLVPNTPVDIAADMYSLGATLYELVSGLPPFGGSAAELARAHLNRRTIDLRQQLPDVPDELASLIQQLLAKDPLRRPASMEAIIDRLMQLELDTLPLRWTQPRPTAA